MSGGTFIIKRKLPSLNDVIAKNRTNKYLAAKFKSDIEEAIGWDIKQALASGKLRPISEPCVVYMNFYESTKRRDVDNVQSSQKFILDSLVKTGVLVNDSRKWVKQTYPRVLDADSDFVEVVIKKVEV